MEQPGHADGITGHRGALGFQLFVGMDSKHLAVYPVQTDGSFPTVLEDYIRMHRAPTKLFSDNAQAEMSNKTKSILRNFGIAEGYAELHYQNQNAAEREIQDIKKDVTMSMNLTNTPYAYWPLCVEYIVMVKNHTARVVLLDRTPQEKRTGQTPDVSKLFNIAGGNLYILSTRMVMKFVGDGQELLSMLVMNLPSWWLMTPQGLQCIGLISAHLLTPICLN
jgi:hypothetical protein